MGELPSSAEEGWLRDQEEVAKPPHFCADGVVMARISWPAPPRPLQQGGFAAFLSVASTPPRL